MIDVVDDKVDELVEILGRVETKLMRLTLLTSRGERVTPSNSYSDWLVVSLFRQWLIEATNPPPPPPAKTSLSHARRHRTDLSSTAATQLVAQSPVQSQHIIPLISHTIKMIGTDRATYLGHEECKKFLKLSSSEHYSRDSLKRFEKRMDEMKGLAADVLRREGLMASELVADGHVGYLTCTRVAEEDYPWSEEV